MAETHKAKRLRAEREAREAAAAAATVTEPATGQTAAGASPVTSQPAGKGSDGSAGGSPPAGAPPSDPPPADLPPKRRRRTAAKAKASDDQIEAGLTLLLSSPSVAFKFTGDTFCEQHFKQSSPILAKEVTNLSRTNKTLRTWLEKLVQGEAAASLVMASIFYVLPPLIHHRMLPNSERMAPLFGVPPHAAPQAAGGTTAAASAGVPHTPANGAHAAPAQAPAG